MHVTICLPTRDRRESIVGTLRSLQALTHADWDAVIVDQSQDSITEDAVHRTIAGDRRFRYKRSPSRGASAARNEAVRLARGPLVAFTDDDCEVSSEWLCQIVAAFADSPAVGLICGEVRAGPHDPERGFVPTYLITRPQCISLPWQKWQVRGIGANMAFRLHALQTIGPWDEMLGPGSPLCLGEDYDVTYRMLRAGFAVRSVPDMYVVHHGFRLWRDASSLMHRSGFGTGAAYMKHLRLGDVAILPTLMHDWTMCISWRHLLRLQRHTGFGYVAMFAWGTLLSFRYPIDHERRIYSLVP